MIGRWQAGRAAWVILALALPMAAAADTLTYTPPACVPSASETEGDLLRCFAPVVIAQGTEGTHNRIGAPELARNWLGHLSARVDSSRAVLYTEVLRDSLGGRALLHLVYRMHFPSIPLRPSLHFFEAHRNPGLLLVVTLDAERREPLFVTTVHTCGCYRALIPTTKLADHHMPAGWPEQLEVHGYTLPARVDPPVAGTDAVVLTLAPDRHRVTDLRIEPLPIEPDGQSVDLALAPLDELRSLPIVGETGRASLFYGAGPLRGHVRGAWNAFEGLTLGWITLDPTVGMDKDFGDPARTGTPFYTMLRFWKHDTSRLDRFQPLLEELGFRPTVLAEEARP